MVTLGGTTTFNEFELHARAVLGYPIPSVVLERAGASAVILADRTSPREPEYHGIDQACREVGIDVRIFGKPTCRPYRRMGVTLASGTVDTSIDELRERARRAAACITLEYP